MIRLADTVSSQKAFTLLELLLVTFIMAAAASVALPNFAKFIRNVEFTKAADDLVSTIRFGQLRALTRGKWMQVKIDPSGYRLEEERSFADQSAQVPGNPVFERLNDRHGRHSRFPDGVNIKPEDAVVILSSDGRIRSPKLEICRLEKCLAIEPGQEIGQVQVVKTEERVLND